MRFRSVATSICLLLLHALPTAAQHDTAGVAGERSASRQGARRPAVWLAASLGGVKTLRSCDLCDASQGVVGEEGSGPLLSLTAGVSLTPRLAVGLQWTAWTGMDFNEMDNARRGTLKMLRLRGQLHPASPVAFHGSIGQARTTEVWFHGGSATAAAFGFGASARLQRHVFISADYHATAASHYKGTYQPGHTSDAVPVAAPVVAARRRTPRWGQLNAVAATVVALNESATEPQNTYSLRDPAVHAVSVEVQPSPQPRQPNDPRRRRHRHELQ